VSKKKKVSKKKRKGKNRSDSDSDSESDSSSNSSSSESNSDSEDEDEDADKKKGTHKKESDEEHTDNSCIKILKIDDNKTLLTHIVLKANKFKKFYCKYPKYRIGVELGVLFKPFKAMEKDGLLSINIDEDNNQILNLDMSKEDDKFASHYEIKTLDLNEKKWKLPESKFTAVVTMECTEFHKICREMHNMQCDYIEIRCTKNTIRFSSIGESIRVVKEYESGGKVSIKANKKDSIVAITNIYELSHFTLFSKCSNICDNVQLFLRHEFPIFARYTIGALGHMLIGVSPICERNIGDNDKEDDYNPADKVLYPRTEIKTKDEN
jgi:proliferating cell nuclear antigen PCNA